VTVAMMVDNPEGSREIYDSVRERLGLEKPAGGILHVAGPSPKWRLASDRGVGVRAGREAVRTGAPDARLSGSRRPRAACAAALARGQLHGMIASR
jgi:hypothetical protein